MKMNSTSQIFSALALGTLLNIGVIGISSKQANAQSTQYNFITRYVTTTTNNQGFFSVNHGVPNGNIWSISVAVQHANGNWHTLEFSNSVDNRFWWNNTSVNGVINSPNFYNKPVKILLFTY
jgi:hypothetical protein